VAVDTHLDRTACERRSFRLALLLTGEARAALAVLESVLAAQPDVRAIDGAHLDRLTILRTRELASARAKRSKRSRSAPAGVSELWSGTTFGDLPGQAREAWVLVRVLALPDREVARAMDCSISAARRHMQLAEEQLGDAGGELEERLRARALTAEVPAVVRERRERASRRRRAEIVAVIVVLLAVTLIVLRTVLR
jgi:hypothetical protein